MLGSLTVEKKKKKTRLKPKTDDVNTSKNVQSACKGFFLKKQKCKPLTPMCFPVCSHVPCKKTHNKNNPNGTQWYELG